MVSAKSSPFDLKFDFGKDLTEHPVLEFPMVVRPDVLPHEPPRDWVMRKKWIHLFWIDPLVAPTEEGLEGIEFEPFDFQYDTMSKLMETTLTLKTFNLMLEGRAQYVIEDYCHIPKRKGYWC